MCFTVGNNKSFQKFDRCCFFFADNLIITVCLYYKKWIFILRPAQDATKREKEVAMQTNKQNHDKKRHKKHV